MMDINKNFDGIIAYIKDTPYRVRRYFVRKSEQISKVIYYFRHFNIKSEFNRLVLFIKNPNIPFTLYLMLFLGFLYWFVIAQSLFIVLTTILDLYQNLDKYMENSVSIPIILSLSLLVIPRWLMMTMPIAVMFGVIMSIASLYQNNELIAIFSSGISIYKLIVPLVLFNLILSMAMIFVDSYLIIPASRLRNTLHESIGETDNHNLNRTDIVIRGADDYFWSADEYVAATRELKGVLVFKINNEYRITERITAARAQYRNNKWIFRSGTRLLWDNTGDIYKEEPFFNKEFEFEEDYMSFQSAMYEIKDMTIIEAKHRIEALKKQNVRYTKELNEYYKKFSFPFTLLIVSLLAVGVSTISRRNILILALFFAIGLAILYYIFQMLILDVLAASGAVNPFMGAWLSVLIFIPVAIVLIRRAKT